jgi:hypothetical protein
MFKVIQIIIMQNYLIKKCFYFFLFYKLKAHLKKRNDLLLTTTNQMT